MRRLFYSLKFTILEFFKYSRPVNILAGYVLAVKAILSLKRKKRLETLLRSFRFAEGALLETLLRILIGKHLQPDNQTIWTDLEIGLERYQDIVADPRLTRTIILKAPRPNGEKGVILSTFEYNWLRIFSGIEDIQKLERQFDFILSTSWSPTDYAILGLALSKLSGTIFVQSCSYAEIPKLERFSPRIKCLETLPCDWVDPGKFSPKPYNDREIDILMVSVWAPFKRHWAFFEALSKMPKDLRVALIGQPHDPYTMDDVQNLETVFGVRQDIEYLESIPVERVYRYQCNSKVSVFFSLREGCCVAAVESSGSPVAMLHDAHIGPKAYINENTGILLMPQRMHRQLLQFLEKAESCRAREWALNRISCYQSIEKLNRLLKEEATRRNRPWTENLVAPCWSAHPTFRSERDKNKLRPQFEKMHERYPRVFGKDLCDRSRK